MTIQINWDNEAKTIIRWDFDGVWTWDEFFESAKLSYQMRIEGVQERPFSLLLNMRDIAPPLSGVLQNMHKSVMLDPDRQGVIVVVGTHKLMQHLAKMFAEAYAGMASKIIVLKTLDDAYRVISEHTTQAE